MKNRGMVLLTALLFLMVMLLVVGSNLLISQLSMKSAQSAQQQLQLEYQALEQHMAQLQGFALDQVMQSSITLPSCPGVYAGWSDAVLQCELLLLETSLQSQTEPIASRYNSLLLRKRLVLPEATP